ncbi:hypothetical protein [Vibrio mediterranei]|uniref:hypothetical protein n=1 Tax=Vibrio mediterranei TaxID=689 RepID=UPI0040682591
MYYQLAAYNQGNYFNYIEADKATGASVTGSALDALCFDGSSHTAFFDLVEAIRLQLDVFGNHDVVNGILTESNGFLSLDLIKCMLEHDESVTPENVNLREVEIPYAYSESNYLLNQIHEHLEAVVYRDKHGDIQSMMIDRRFDQLKQWAEESEIQALFVPACLV